MTVPRWFLVAVMALVSAVIGLVYAIAFVEDK